MKHETHTGSTSILAYRDNSSAILNNVIWSTNITRTKSQNLYVARLVLQLSLPNPVKPGVKSITKTV